ncbi:MAG: aminotransferase class I/II-fold pyridoxal phosphate-dependent enzyme [Candidatus Magasanikbacteria bacterium]
MIFTGFQPNATKKDLSIALSFLLLPWKWFLLRKGIATLQVEEWLQKYFLVPYAVTFDSGRTALQKSLEALEIEKGDEVLVQAYTCMVVSNAIHFAMGTPVYVDILHDYTMDPEDLKNKITSKSKVLIIQHTFGQAAHVDKLVAIAQEHGLKIIEDCAHSLGATYKGKLTGTFGDIGMFSFGSDKVISCIRGGATITSDSSLGEKLQKLSDGLPLTRRLKVIQYLITIPFFAAGKPLYKFGGKIFLAVCKYLNVTGRIMYEKEKRGESVKGYPSKLPQALAVLLLSQLDSLKSFNEHRKSIAHIFFSHVMHKKVLPEDYPEHIFLRFPLQVSNIKELHRESKRRGILLGNWYDTVIAPKDCDISKSGYILGSCPRAEKMSSNSINLPTDIHITEKDALYISNFINTYARF